MPCRNSAAKVSMTIDGIARSIDNFEVLPQPERTKCRTRKMSHFGLRGRSLIWKNQPEAAELDATPVRGLHPGAYPGQITDFLYSTLAKRVKEVEKAAGEIDDLKLRFPL